MAVPRESWVILSDFRVSLIRHRVLASGQIVSVIRTYEAHLPTLEKLQE